MKRCTLGVLFALAMLAVAGTARTAPSADYLINPMIAGEIFWKRYGERIQNDTNGALCFEGYNGTDNTDLCIDLDGTAPALYSPTDASVSIADGLSITLPAAGAFTVDGDTTNQTQTLGAIDVNVGTVTANVAAGDFSLTQDNGTVAATDSFGVRINLTQNDADGDLFGLRVSAAATANAAAGSYEYGISVVNNENTAGVMPDAFLCNDAGGVGGGIIDCFDGSTANATNALYAGNNPVQGDTYGVLASAALTLGDALTGTNTATVAVFSSDWEISTAGVMTGIGAITTDGTFTMTGPNVDLDPTGTFALDMDAGQAVTFTLSDNLNEALLVREGANTYLEVDTQDADANLVMGNASTNPDFEFIGGGDFDVQPLFVRVNSNAAAATSEEPYVILLGGDGVGAPNDDIVASTIEQDSVNEILEFKVQRSRNGGAYADIAPVLQVGETGQIADLDPALQFVGGTGAASNSATISFDGSTDDLILGTGATEVTLAVSAEAAAGLLVSAGDLTHTGVNVNYDPTGTYDLSMDAGQAAQIHVSDNLGTAFLVEETVGGDDYLIINTLNGVENVSIGNAVTNPAFNFLGAGTVDVAGSVAVGDAATDVLSCDSAVPADGAFEDSAILRLRGRNDPAGAGALATQDVDIFNDVSADDGTNGLVIDLDGGADELTLSQAGNLTITGVFSGSGATTYDAGGAAQITVGSGDVTAVVVTVDGTGTGEFQLPAGAIDATEIVDVNRSVNLPVTALVNCSDGGFLDWAEAADNNPDFAQLGMGTVVLAYDDTGGSIDADFACIGFRVPADYASGGTFGFRITQDAATAANIEDLSVSVSINGAAFGAPDSDALADQMAMQTVTSAPAGAYAAGDSVVVRFGQADAAADDIVYIHALSYEYVATQ